MKNLIIINILSFFLAADISTLSISIKNDRSLIVPAIGAENILLHQNGDDLLSLKGYPDRISDTGVKTDLFRDVFKIDAPDKIIFDKIYYYNSEKAVFFLNENNISAIAGMNSQRITIDSVDLSRGAEYFIFSYGNRNLRLLYKDNSGDIIYYYSSGIAIVDDRSDDKIDMYIIFKTEK